MNEDASTARNHFENERVVVQLKCHYVVSVLNSGCVCTVSVRRTESLDWWNHSADQ